MKRFVWAGVLAVTLAGGLRANESIAAGRLLALAVKKPVQEELKLTARQIAAVERLYTETAKDEKAGAAAALARELEPGQLARLKEISYQVRGGWALIDADVQTTLGLSRTQARQIADLWKDKEEDLRQVLRIARFKNAAVKRRYILEKRQNAGKALRELLNAEQEAAFKKLQGKAIELKGLDS